MALYYLSVDVWLIGPSFAEQQPLTYQQVLEYCQQNNINVPPNFTSFQVRARYSGGPPAHVYTLTRGALNDNLLACLYNGNTLRVGIDYTLATDGLTLSFNTSNGDNLYALYAATSAT